MVSLTYELWAKNTGVSHDLICGVSIFDTSLNFVADLPWFVIYNAPANMTQVYHVTISGIQINLSSGNYIARSRAWKSYTPGTVVGEFEGGVGVVYGSGTGAVYDTTSGDGIYLDQFDRSFSVTAGAISADITDLQITV